MASATSSCRSSTSTASGHVAGSVWTVKCTSARADSVSRTVKSTDDPSRRRRSTSAIAMRDDVVYRSRGTYTRHETNRRYGSGRRKTRTVRRPATASTPTAVSCSCCSVLLNSSSRGSAEMTSSICWPE